VLHDPAAIAERCLRLATRGEVVALDGTVLKVGARSICIHGDNPEAVAIARRVRGALESAGVEIRAPI
jgi:5-oxoprolinase (ATP-hydrolysing) subunit A